MGEARHIKKQRLIHNLHSCLEIFTSFRTCKSKLWLCHYKNLPLQFFYEIISCGKGAENTNNTHNCKLSLSNYVGSYGSIALSVRHPVSMLATIATAFH